MSQNTLLGAYTPLTHEDGVQTQQVMGNKLIEAVRRGLIRRPASQRPEDSWNTSQRNDYVNFILSQYGKPRFTVPALVVLQVEEKDETFWLIYDGQQRLGTYVGFVLDMLDDEDVASPALIEDTLPFQLENAGFALPNNNQGIYNIPKGAEGKTFNELSEELQTYWRNTRFEVKVYSSVVYSRDRADQELFPALQNGKRLTSGQRLNANHRFSNNNLINALTDHPLFTTTNGKRRYAQVAGDTNPNSLIASLVFTVSNFKGGRLPRRFHNSDFSGTPFVDVRYRDDVEPWSKSDQGLLRVPQGSESIQRYLDTLDDLLFVLSNKESPKAPLGTKEFIILFSILDRERGYRTGDDFQSFRNIARDAYHSVEYHEMRRGGTWATVRQSHNKQAMQTIYELIWGQIRSLEKRRSPLAQEETA